jgi:two-component system, NtrC family, response regulator AtoC
MTGDNIMQGKKLLICDDDNMVTGFLERFLRNEGYTQIDIVSSGEAVLEKVTKERYDLVLLDVMLPGMNGIEILQRIKEIDKKTAVVMITGFPEEKMALQALKMGAYDYIIKPFDLAYLKLVVLSKILLDSK